jgi:hypothetical protein
MSIGYEVYENSVSDKPTVDSGFKVNKYLNSALFTPSASFESKEMDMEIVENDINKTNVTFYGTTAGCNSIELQNLKENIEKMSKFHQIEILRILSTSSSQVCLNENNNGTFVNLTEQSKDIIIQLNKYVKYVNEQQNQLSIIEDEKSRLEKIFCKDNKDKQ